MQHVGDGTRLTVFAHQLAVGKQLFHVVGPLAIVLRLAQQSQVFLRCLGLSAQHGAAGHVLQQFHAPAVLHALFQTHAVALVQHAVMVVNQPSGRVIHIDGQGRIAFLRTFAEIIHLVALTTQTAQGQVVHHDDGARGFAVHLFPLGQRAFPVGLLDAALHAQFVVEVLVLIPEMPYGGSKGA